MQHAGRLRPGGTLTATVRREPPTQPSWWTLFWWAFFHRSANVPRRWKLANARRMARPLIRIGIARLLGLQVIYGSLYNTVQRADGQVEDYGLVSLRVVTTAGATKIVDFLRANDVTTGQNWKFHGVGTGSTAENITDTALVTELTTQYASDSTRPTGTQTNNGATVYRTVATISPDSGFPIVLREHGVFALAAVGSGTLLDRSVFGATTINVSGDSYTPTYDFTVTPGS